MTKKDDRLFSARVIAQHREKYRVLCSKKEFWAEITGNMRLTAQSKIDYPVVGDMVNISILENDHAIIHDIFARKTFLQRKTAGQDSAQPIAANIDTAFVVQSVDRDFNLHRIDRYLTIIKAGKIKPVIILNKADLISPDELAKKVLVIKNRFKKINILPTNTLSKHGIDKLAKSIKKDKVYCFIGSSGVGKSSIINVLLGQNIIETKSISSHTNKGQHMTTHRELYTLKNGGLVIDTPGIREVGIVDPAKAVNQVFNDIDKLATNCKFGNCTHSNEPGCSVLLALENGNLSEDKYLNYIKLKKEAEHYSATTLEKRQKDRSFGKMCKKVMKHKKKQKW